MASVFFTRSNGQILVWDNWRQGQRSGQATVTDYAIEDGSRVAKHSQAQPTQITLQLLQTETPLDAGNNAVGPERIRRAMDFCEEVGRSGEPLEVTIPRMGFYENMVLEGWPNSFDNAKDSDFEITLKRIRIADVQTVQVPIEEVAPPARGGQQPEADTGKQTTGETDTEQVEEDLSVFDRVSGGGQESALKAILG